LSFKKDKMIADLTSSIAKRMADFEAELVNIRVSYPNEATAASISGSMVFTSSRAGYSVSSDDNAGKRQLPQQGQRMNPLWLLRNY